MVGAAIRRRPALAAAVIVFVVAALGMRLTQHSLSLPLPRGQAIAAAVKNPDVHQILRRVRWDRITVGAVDTRLDRITFFEGARTVAEIAITRAGHVVEAEDVRSLRVPYGDWIAYQPAILILLAALFVLVTGVAPWRRLRNLDVAAALTLMAPVVLLQHGYVNASVLAAVPGLTYLAVRCALLALAGARPAGPSTPLLDLLTPEWGTQRRIRLLRILMLAMAVVFLLVTVSSFDAVDVVYAVMEGATKLLGGVLPYGHMPGDVIHGDTYPLLSYVFYVPLAWLSPVHSVWDSVDLALGLGVIASLIVAWTVFRVVAVGNRPPASRMAPERELAGLRSALAWMAFPPVLVITSSGTSDVVLGAMLAGAVLLWRRPAVCTTLLAVGAWFKLAPIALVPVRLASLRGRALVSALAGLVIVTLPMLAVLVVLGGLGGPMAMLHAMAYQFSRGSPQSIWSALGISALQPAGEAAVLGLIAAAMVQLRRHPSIAEDRSRMAALSVAVLAGLQLAANYWAFLYLVWVVPILAMSVLGEPDAVNAAEHQPASLPAQVRAAGAAV